MTSDNSDESSERLAKELAAAAISTPPGVRVVADALTPITSATRNFHLNHSMLRITNPEASLRFFVEFLGMSRAYTYNAGPFTVYWLGYPLPDDKTPSEIVETIPTRSSLLELIYVHPNPADPKPHALDNEQGKVAFGHLGFFVPDVDAVIARAEKFGYKIIKYPSDISNGTMALPDYVEENPFPKHYVKVYSMIGFVEAPDG